MSVMLANTMATSIFTVAEEYSSPAETSLRSSHPPFRNRQKIARLVFEEKWFEGKCAGWVSQGGEGGPAAGADFRALVHLHGENRDHQQRRRRLLTHETL